MEIYDYTVEKEESGIRIDRYLAEKDSGLSRSFIQKLLKDGQITVGDKAAKSNYKVRENDRIHLEIPDSSEPDIVPEDIPLDILYGQHRTSTSGRYGIWVFKKSLSSGGTGSSCNDSWVCSSTYL